MADKRGNLSFAEAKKQIPFDIARVYWIYDVPGGQKRGSHAYKNQEEVIIALSGSFDVVLDDGNEKRRHTLNRSYMGLYVPNKMWRSLENFSTNSVCIVLASMPYDENEYIRKYKDFKKYIREPETPKPILQVYNPVPDNTVRNETTVFDCTLSEFPIIRHKGGNITPIHNSENVPFDIKRVFYIYDIPSGEIRGGHAHKYCHQFLVAASGSFEVELDDGTNKMIVPLNRPMIGLHLPPGVWAIEKNFSAGAVCLVLASHEYKEEEYIRKYPQFKAFRSDGNKDLQ